MGSICSRGRARRVQLEPETQPGCNTLVLENRITNIGLRRLCQYAAEALLEGSDKRPPLPLEVVRTIFVSGGFTIPSPSLRVHTDIPLEVTATSATIVRQCWMVTDGFDAQTLVRLASIRLTTVSAHQGWVSNSEEGSWSWFELAVLSPLDENTPMIGMSDGHVKQRSNGAPLTWESHRHPVDQDGHPSRYDGVEFHADHELWTHLSPGDRLGVFGCAQFAGWQCIGDSAVLEFEEYFDHSSSTAFPS